MAAMTSGAALRQIQVARSHLRKARQMLQSVRPGQAERDASAAAIRDVVRAGWQSLTQTHKLLAEIPFEAANEDVMFKLIALERYAAALLVRLRRLSRGESLGDDTDDRDDDDESL